MDRFMNNWRAQGRKNPNRLDWGWVSEYQKLTAAELREFKDRLDWGWVSQCQKLTAADLREFKDRLDWGWVSRYQKAQPNKPERINRAKKYAAIHHLKTTEAGFYAYRNHDAWGRGSFNKAIIYASG